MEENESALNLLSIGCSPIRAWPGDVRSPSNDPVSILGVAAGHECFLNFLGMTSNHQKLDCKVYSIGAGDYLPNIFSTTSKNAFLGIPVNGSREAPSIVAFLTSPHPVTQL